MRRAKPIEKRDRNTKFVRKDSKFSFGSSLVSSESSKNSISKYTSSLDSIDAKLMRVKSKDKSNRSVIRQSVFFFRKLYQTATNAGDERNTGPQHTRIDPKKSTCIEII